VLFLVPPAGSASPTVASSITKPNIVFIITDDQRHDQLSEMPVVQQELIGKGVDFTNAFVSDPLCCPSRASILRGQYAHSTGVYNNGGPYGGWKRVRALHLEKSTLATWLKAAGYRTALIGKYFNGYNKMSVVPAGWTTWRGKWQANYFDYKMSVDGVTRAFGATPADYEATVLSNFADSFIRGTSPSKPLFLYLAFHAPHSPWVPAPAHENDPACQGESDTDPAVNEDTSDKPSFEAAYPELTPEEVQQAAVTNWRLACETLRSVDEGVGQVLKALQDTGRLSNTLIVFLGDNGLLYGEHRVETGKDLPYEESIRVPMILRYDPMTDGVARVDPHLVLNIDLAPTVADLLHLTVRIACTTPPWGGVCNHRFDGKSLMPLIDPTSTKIFSRSDFLIEHYDDPGPDVVPNYCGVRTTHYMYTRYADGEEELYDLQSDPYELTNLLDENTDPSVEALRQQLLARDKVLCSPTPPNYSFGP
jgi:N-acetylglucosamine-6-sulfatase